jgi:1-acyl-sn-glycerol-3-phosphate acyltransferase
MLEGAPVRAGVAALSNLAEVPVLPCVILGSDRLYNKKRWLPLRRTPIWIAFGHPISAIPGSEKSVARQQIEREFTAALNNLCRELRETFALTEEDFPHPPRERMRE